MSRMRVVGRDPNSGQGVQLTIDKGTIVLIEPTDAATDLWISAGDPFSESTLNRRRKVHLITGLEAFLGAPEDVLLHKLVWNQITPSDRQLGDAAGIVAVQSSNLDVPYMRLWAARQGNADILEEVLAGKHLKTT